MIPRRTEAANTKKRWPERFDGAAAMGHGLGSTGIDEMEEEMGGSHPPINSTLMVRPERIDADGGTAARRPTPTRPSIHEGCR